jgi:hypothetical protein
MLTVRRTRNEGWFEEAEALTCGTVVPGVSARAVRAQHFSVATPKHGFADVDVEE